VILFDFPISQPLWNITQHNGREREPASAVWPWSEAYHAMEEDLKMGALCFRRDMVLVITVFSSSQLLLCSALERGLDQHFMRTPSKICNVPTWRQYLLHIVVLWISMRLFRKALYLTILDLVDDCLVRDTPLERLKSFSCRTY